MQDVLAPALAAPDRATSTGADGYDADSILAQEKSPQSTRAAVETDRLSTIEEGIGNDDEYNNDENFVVPTWCDADWWQTIGRKDRRQLLKLDAAVDDDMLVPDEDPLVSQHHKIADKLLSPVVPGLHCLTFHASDELANTPDADEQQN